MFRNWNTENHVSATLNQIVKYYDGIQKYQKLEGPFFPSWFQSRQPDPNNTISRRDSSSDEESISPGLLTIFFFFLAEFLRWWKSS